MAPQIKTNSFPPPKMNNLSSINYMLSALITGFICIYIVWFVCSTEFQSNFHPIQFTITIREDKEQLISILSKQLCHFLTLSDCIKGMHLTLHICMLSLQTLTHFTKSVCHFIICIVITRRRWRFNLDHLHCFASCVILKICATTSCFN